MGEETERRFLRAGAESVRPNKTPREEGRQRESREKEESEKGLSRENNSRNGDGTPSTRQEAQGGGGGDVSSRVSKERCTLRPAPGWDKRGA